METKTGPNTMGRTNLETKLYDNNLRNRLVHQCVPTHCEVNSGNQVQQVHRFSGELRLLHVLSGSNQVHSRG